MDTSFVEINLSSLSILSPCSVHSHSLHFVHCKCGDYLETAFAIRGNMTYLYVRTYMSFFLILGPVLWNKNHKKN